MLIFTIPLRSRAVSHDWDLVSRLCGRTLLSCSNQTAPHFRIVLICNEAPAVPRGVRNLTIIKEDFPIPTSKKEQSVDKYRKLQRGLIEVRNDAPFYWMKVDSDDCVSNRLADFFATQHRPQSWIAKRGYIYSEGSNKLYLEKDIFYKVCGTSSILWQADTETLPRSMEEDKDDFDFLRTSHSDLDKLIRRGGSEPAYVPFPTAIYCVGSGENWSGFNGVGDFKSMTWSVRRVVNSRRLTPEIRSEFSLVEAGAGVGGFSDDIQSARAQR